MGEQVRVNSDAMLMGALLHTESKEEPLANPTWITLHFMLSPVWAQSFPHIADSVLCGCMSTYFATMAFSLPVMTPLMSSPGTFVLLFRSSAYLPPYQMRKNPLFRSYAQIYTLSRILHGPYGTMRQNCYFCYLKSKITAVNYMRRNWDIGTL